MEKSKPKVILSAAITLDGKIATRSGDSKLSSTVDKKRLHKLRSTTDSILVGKNTIKNDDPLLTVRHVKGKNPIRIIIDPQGEISSNSKIIKSSSKISTIIVVSKKISRKNLQRIKGFPVQILMFDGKKINLKALLKELSKNRIRSILLEGGGVTNWEFVKNTLIDAAIITVTPFLVGGKDAVSLVEGKGFSKISNSLKLKLKRVTCLKNEVVLHYTKP